MSGTANSDALTGEAWGGAATDGPARRPSVPTSTIRSPLALPGTHRCRGSGPGNAGRLRQVPREPRGQAPRPG